MLEVTDAAALHAALQPARAGGASVGFVPTMGFLHAGHLRLMAAARDANELIVVSIFVNPTQFGPGEDLDRYPRDLERDRALCAEAGVDVLFVPEPGVLYRDGPEGQQVWVDPGALAARLEGAHRPGHFRGVATVVAKLFALVRPQRAYFGQKDAQQAIIIRRMVRDLALDLELVVVPTVREPDGLALSSRNVYLSGEERRQAPALFHALQTARSVIETGEREACAVERALSLLLAAEAPAAQVDYAAVADLQTLAPVARIEGDVLIALAASFGRTRLIDNMMVRFAGDGLEFS